ncbi:MAG TPA: glutamyl-tRNA reductase [Dehalococcoidia bacterium]|nr:glutamyl-tRNA reductase [Dehalococcoidia bacterium]
MNICLVGINHRTAPVAIREKAAIRTAQLDDALQSLHPRLSHGVILSTCNRTEVYYTTDDDSDAKTVILGFLQNLLDVSDTVLRKHTYVLNGEASVEHLFRIASGLDSMVTGEYEVLGQVRQALEIAEKAKMVNLPLRHVFQSAVRTGRRVRKETGISKNAFSTSSVAVDLAASIVTCLEGCKMLVVGTGEAGRLVAKAAKDRGVSHIAVASRSRERGLKLTKTLGGMLVSLSNLVAELHSCNIIVTCSNAPHFVLDVTKVDMAMRKRPELPLVIIDIAVPRNVEPAVGQINNVFLYNIDDLASISERNRYRRKSAVREAENIIAAEMNKFNSWWQDFKIRPLISAIMDKAEKIRLAQLNRTVKKMPSLSDRELYSLEMMTRAIITKILKDPIRFLKDNRDSDYDYTDIVKELFQLSKIKRDDE